MFKIGEFSKITQVSVRMLRYYDEQKLLTPCVVDEYSGYRFYSARQIQQLNRIILLRDMGFGIREMKKMLALWDAEQIQNNLREQLRKTEEDIKAQQMKLHQIQGMLSDLEQNQKPLEIEIMLKSLPMQHVLSMRRVVANYYCEGALWEEFGKYLLPMKGIEHMQCFSIYHDLDYREENVDIEICIVPPLEETVIGCKEIIYRQVEEVDMAACFLVYGPYSNISRAYQEFAFWLERHPEYHMSGENRQICHVAANRTENPAEYVTELQIPLSFTP